MVKILKGTEVPNPGNKSNFGRLDELGREIPDGRPMEPPLGFKPTPDLMETIRAMIINEKALDALNEPETFEEAENFNTGEDMGPEDYEPYFEPTSTEEMLQRQRDGQPLHDVQEPPTSPPKASDPPGSPNPAGTTPPPVAAV